MSVKTAPLVAFTCPLCAKTYRCHPAAVVLCTHAGTPKDAFKPALAIATKEPQT
jgi:hypothetical protein